MFTFWSEGEKVYILAGGRKSSHFGLREKKFTFWSEGEKVYILAGGKKKFTFWSEGEKVYIFV